MLVVSVFIVSVVISATAPEVRFDPRDRHSCDGIAIGKPLAAPTFNDPITRQQKGAAIELLITSVGDTPIDRTPQRAVIRVIALAEDFIPAGFDVSDTRSKLETLTSFRGKRVRGQRDRLSGVGLIVGTLPRLSDLV
jgi:hypothetical protein